MFIKLRKFLIKDYFRHGWTRLFIKKTRFGGGMGMAYIVLSYTKYRHSSTIPPKYFGFAEGLLRRAGLKAGPAGLVLANKRTPLRGCS